MGLLTYHAKGKYFAVGNKNPIQTMPKFIDGIPISDKKGHGIGTKSIVYYVQQLSGQCHFSVEEHCFVLKIILSRCI